MKKRLFSLMTALSMCIGLLPGGALPVFAVSGKSTAGTRAGKVEYHRVGESEIPLLNAVTGNDRKFYESLKVNYGTGNYLYNAVIWFGRDYSGYWEKGTGGWNLLDYNIKTPNHKFGEMNLVDLIQSTNDIEVSFSSTMTSHTHTHKTAGYRIELEGYETASLTIMGNTVVTLNGYAGTELTASARRVGDNEFHKVSYNAAKANDNGSTYVSFYPAEVNYYVKNNLYSCTCEDSKADAFVIAFRDADAPKLRKLYYSTDGENWTDNSRTLRVNGEKLYIKLSYDEPIRFADDSADGTMPWNTSGWSAEDEAKIKNLKDKRELYIQLLQSGDEDDPGNESNKAYPYRLDGNDLYFEYDIGTASRCEQITAIGTGGLFGTDIPLLTLAATGPKAVFLQAPTEGGYKVGYNLSECYVTDMAGNPLPGESITGANLVIDTEKPYVEQVQFHASTNNSDVKSVLTVNGVPKDQLDPKNYEDITRYESDYNDDSDRFLGVGDSISFTLKMNEKLKLDTERGPSGKGYRLNWRYAVATTNIKAPEGYSGSQNDAGYITVRAEYYSPLQYKLNTSAQSDVTAITTNWITITEGMTVSDTKGEIKITGLTFDFTGAAEDYKNQFLEDGKVVDLTGNQAQDYIEVKDKANVNPYHMDVTPLVIGGGEDTPLSADLTGTDKGFRYMLTLGLNSGEETVGTDCAEFRGILGSFILKNKGDGLEYEYEYLAVPQVIEAEKLSEQVWKTGKTGLPVTFTQAECVYLYVRAKNGVEYHDLRDCTLIVTAGDYAGTTATVELPVTEEGAPSTLAWYIDTVAPAVTAGEVTRRLNETGGSLTASVVLSDSHGISEWDYAWSDSQTEEPTAWTAGGGLTEGDGNTVTVSTAGAQVESQTLFSKYLWVRAVDRSDKRNVATQCLGLYTYDLRNAEYTLRYSATFMEKANVEIAEQRNDETLYFLIPSQYESKKENEYHLLRLDGSTAAKNSNIFAMGGWKTCQLRENGNGTYDFENQFSQARMSPLTDGSYAGNLDVIVLAGKTAGASNSGAGTESYQFSKSTLTLKVTSSKPEQNYTYHVDYDVSPITLTGTAQMEQYVSDKDRWASTDSGLSMYQHTVLSTLEGVPLTITIPYDHFGWQCRDIDWQNSGIVLTNHTDQSTYEVGIKAFQVNTSGEGPLSVQVVTLPAASCTGGSNTGVYTTGTYTAVLKLRFKVGDYTLSVNYSNSHLARAEFVVDATEAKGGFTIQTIGYGVESMYNTNQYDIMDLDSVYEGGEYSAEEDGIIYIPVSRGELLDQTKYNVMTTYRLTIDCPGESAIGSVGSVVGGQSVRSYTGVYVIQMWNEADPTNVVVLKPDNDEQTVVTNTVDSLYHAPTGFVIDNAAFAKQHGLVNLTADEVNTVVLKKVYSNGKTIQSKVDIRPVTQHLTGSLSVNGRDKVLTFTPDAAAAVNAVGAKVYAFVYQNGIDYKKPTENYSLVAMDQQSDGTWTCPLAENGAKYRVLTINAHGSVWVDEMAYTADRAPWFGTPSFTDHGDGTWTLELDVYDDYRSMQNGNWDDILISFAEGYTKQNFRFDSAKFVKDEMNGIGKYVWSCGDSISPTGIVRVTVSETDYHWGEDIETYSGALNITLEGVFLNVEQSDMGLTVTAEDATGNRGELSVDATVARKPLEVIGQKLTSAGLELTFNQPMKPTETWAWVEKDDGELNYIDGKWYAKGFKNIWVGAFPIIANGTYTLTVRDVTGGVQTVTVEIDAFTDSNGRDWSVLVEQSETELTREAVYLTATLKQSKNDGAGIWLLDQEEDLIVPEGWYNGTETQESMRDYDAHGNNGRFYGSHVTWSILNYFATSSPRTVKRETNGTVWLEVYAERYSWQVANYSYSPVFVQAIHLNNIANEAPAGEVIYTSESMARSFTYSELAEYVETYHATFTGNIRATYQTSRTVTPTGDQSVEFLFTPENYATAAHTFTYVDEMGNSGSVEAKLPAGVKLEREQTVDMGELQFAPDTTAPTLNVEIYAKRGGSYTAEEAFFATNTEAEIREKFNEISYVQGYRLVINAADTSGCDIQVTGENGGVLTEGITLTGNILTVERTGTVTITATDRSTNRNQTAVTLSAATMGQWIDTEPPTVDIALESPSLYQRNLYVSVSDLSGTAEPVSPAGLVKVENDTADPWDQRHIGAYKLVVTKSGTVTVTVRDQAGNRTVKTCEVSGIDTTPPALTVTWSPPYSEIDYETGNTVTDTTRPTQSAVNSDVTALVDSDKAMYDLTVTINGGTPVKLLERGAATAELPYKVQGQNGTLVTITATPERITVTYHENYDATMLFTATAANGASGTAEVCGYLRIDKMAPTITETLTPLYRTDEAGVPYTTPYGVTVKLEADEWVLSPNYGGYDVYTDPYTGETERIPLMYERGENALMLQVTADGTYRVYFNDEAGNVTVHTVRVNAGIDDLPPKLTVGERDESNNRVRVSVTINETGTLTVAGQSYAMTAGVPREVTFTDNGSYLLTAVDSAGNHTTAVVTVGTIDKILPSVRFDTGTVYLLEGNATAEDLRAALDSGYLVWDNVTAESVLRAGCVIDTSAVQLNVSGRYPVPYTVTDEAGNYVTVNRFVEVIGKDTVCVEIDGELILPNGTAVLGKGTHRIVLANNTEGYTLKARQGIFGIGQMKYLSESSLSFDENGNFTVDGFGYYTLLATTQSRKTIRILLYITE